MIVLSLLKFLEDNNLGKIDQDLFWEKIGLGKNGVYIASVGASQDRGMRNRQDYIVYSRGKTDIESYQNLEKIRKFLNNSYDICTLPSVPPVFSREYHNVTIMPPSSITNVGLDTNGRMVWSFTGTIYY